MPSVETFRHGVKPSSKRSYARCSWHNGGVGLIEAVGAPLLTFLLPDWKQCGQPSPYIAAKHSLLLWADPSNNELTKFSLPEVTFYL